MYGDERTQDWVLRSPRIVASGGGASKERLEKGHLRKKEDWQYVVSLYCQGQVPEGWSIH